MMVLLCTHMNMPLLMTTLEPISMLVKAVTVMPPMDPTLLPFLMAEFRRSTTMLLMNTVAMLLMSSTVDLLATLWLMLQLMRPSMVIMLQFTHPSMDIMVELLFEHIYKLNYSFNK